MAHTGEKHREDTIIDPIWPSPRYVIWGPGGHFAGLRGHPGSLGCSGIIENREKSFRMLSVAKM